MGYGEFYSNMTVDQYDSVIESVTAQRDAEKRRIAKQGKRGYGAWRADVDYIQDANQQLKILRNLRRIAGK